MTNLHRPILFVEIDQHHASAISQFYIFDTNCGKHSLEGNRQQLNVGFSGCAFEVVQNQQRSSQESSLRETGGVSGCGFATTMNSNCTLLSKGRLCNARTCLANEYSLTWNDNVGPRGVLAILMFVELLVVEKMTKCVTPTSTVLQHGLRTHIGVPAYHICRRCARNLSQSSSCE
jgi:hypothetical protein